MDMSGMISVPGISIASSCMLIAAGILFIFGSRENRQKIQNIVWSTPIPSDLLSRLREFSPAAISKTSGIYLDDVFDILRGTKARTAPEVIEKLDNTIKILQKRDEELEREAVKIGYMIRGFDAIEQRELEKRNQTKLLADKEKR
jgi:hypothetical protein